MSRTATAAAATAATTATAPLARSVRQAMSHSPAPLALISANSAYLRSATSQALSSTTTAPVTARPTYINPSRGATARSSAMNGPRMAGSWETVVTGAASAAPPGITRPVEVMPLMLDSSEPAWSAVSWFSRTGSTQLTCMYSGLSRVASWATAPGPVKTAPM